MPADKHDPPCVVEVGTHEEPYWKRTVDGKIFCGRHARQMTERDPEQNKFEVYWCEH